MFPMRTPLSIWIALACMSLAARADFLTGQVVDSAGNPVAGLDIDVKNNGSGGTPTIFNDGTDAGGFFNVTIPAGDYDVTFNPPAPPLAVAMALEIKDVIISGTKSLGVVHLPAAVAASGTVLTSTGLPVGGVNIDVVDKSTGINVDLLNDTTDAFGNFSLAIPGGEVAFRINPTAAHADLAPLQLDLSLSASVSLGTVVLEPGFAVSGLLLGAGGAPVANVDIDLFDATGKKLYTPGDNSQGTGFFSVTAPVGSLELRIRPVVATHYVAASLPVSVVAAPVNQGVVSLVKGKIVSGHVSSSLASAEGGVNLDVTDPLTGLDVAVCADSTNGQGNFAIVVPVGTFDFKFDPKGYDKPLGAKKQLGVSVGADMTLNAILPDCPFPVSYGKGSPGTLGLVPQLTAPGGAPRLGNLTFGFQLDQGAAGSVAVLAIGFAPASLPLFGGTLLVDPLSNLLFVFSPTGSGSTPIALPGPIQGNFDGITIFAQAVVVDAVASGGLALSNGVTFTICD